jgi:hypothetical protein
MKLTYCVADALTDHPAYSIRERTRKACKERVEAQGEYANQYGEPRKIVVEYQDGFDLVRQALGEGGIEGERQSPH